MKGQKYNDDMKEKAFALLATNNNAQVVADKLGIPYTTVKTWEKKFLKEDQSKSGDEVTKPNLVEVRRKKKEEFAESAWDNIMLGVKLINRRLKRAFEEEDKIDNLLEVAMEDLDEEDAEKERSNPKKRIRVANKIDSLKLDNITQISTMLGTLYDKQALANDESTANTKVTLEDYLRKCETKNEY